jgi:hypothetical protein
MSSIVVHMYVNNIAIDVYNLTKTQSFEFRSALLNQLKPLNKQFYLELDLEFNEEYGILKCTNEHGEYVAIPNDILSKINRYIYIPIPVSNGWKSEDKITVLLSLSA